MSQSRPIGQVASARVKTAKKSQVVLHSVVVTSSTGRERTVCTGLFHHHCQRVSRFINEFCDVEITSDDLEEAAFDRSFDGAVA